MTALVLASRSAARSRMMAAAGLSFSTAGADIDERVQELDLSGLDRTPDRIAAHLASVKAAAVGSQFPDAVVVGADQTLDLEGERFVKPKDLDEARAQLLRLKGRSHVLHSAVACVRGGEVDWQCVETARLTMRDFSDRFIDDYLAVAGARALSSVGAYHLEGVGVQLFEKVEGDFFTILGLPLLPLLSYLRATGIVAS
ncbi:Maf family protein [Amorphus sp. MBR-141]